MLYRVTTIHKTQTGSRSTTRTVEADSPEVARTIVTDELRPDCIITVWVDAVPESRGS